MADPHAILAQLIDKITPFVLLEASKATPEMWAEHRKTTEWFFQTYPASEAVKLELFHQVILAILIEHGYSDCAHPFPNKKEVIHDDFVRTHIKSRRIECVSDGA